MAHFPPKFIGLEYRIQIHTDEGLVMWDWWHYRHPHIDDIFRVRILTEERVFIVRQVVRSDIDSITLRCTELLGYKGARLFPDDWK